jgi:hypothetical protein
MTGPESAERLARTLDCGPLLRPEPRDPGARLQSPLIARRALQEVLGPDQHLRRFQPMPRHAAANPELALISPQVLVHLVALALVPVHLGEIDETRKRPPALGIARAA